MGIEETEESQASNSCVSIFRLLNSYLFEI